MFITREMDYAIRTLRALSQSEKLTVNQICLQENIPMAFGYRILKKLSRSGMVRILRGSTGGYCLDRDMREVTLLDVILAIEPLFIINECLEPGYDCPNNPAGGSCQVHHELIRIQAALQEELRRSSLAEILSRSCPRSVSVPGQEAPAVE